MILFSSILVTPPKGLIMTDSRILKLADVLVHYSLELKPDQQLILRTNPLADELALAVYAEALKAGVHVFPQISLPNSEEIFFKYASEKQLDFISPVRKLIVESFDAQLVIGAEYNTRALTGIDPARISRSRKASAPLSKIFLERAARMELRWCYTEYPTQASAQEADMSLMDYQEFVFDAGLLNEPDPVAAWINEGKKEINQPRQESRCLDVSTLTLELSIMIEIHDG
jgi:aminopeptidase